MIKCEEYIKGRQDLILEIKEEIIKILDDFEKSDKSDNVMFDLLILLKNLK